MGCTGLNALFLSFGDGVIATWSVGPLEALEDSSI
jgi:hypothetical protein